MPKTITVPEEARARALLEMRRRQREKEARSARPYGEWMAEAIPSLFGQPVEWTARHFVEMQKVLDRVTLGELMRVLFQLPIGHGKSACNTVGYSGYRIERNPQTRILIGSFNAGKAAQFSREIQTLVSARGIPLSRDRTSASEWETAAGGWIRAVGAGSGTAGMHPDLLLIDDPIGSRRDAESKAYRDQVWDWVTNDLLSRCDPGTAVIFTMARWHQDDPAGRLLDQQGPRWHVLDLPGRAEPGDPLGRAEGEPLWPEHLGEDWLDGKRAELGEYGFASLVQGRPRPREGGMFRWSWWKELEAVPEKGHMVRYWDLAGTEATGKGHDPDWTAGALLCRMEDRRTAIVDVTRFRKSVAARDTEIERIARNDVLMYPSRVTWWFEKEAGIAGTDRMTNLVRRIQNCGLSVQTEHPSGNKVLRCEPLASATEAGNVLLCPGDWKDWFRTELADFPHGKHDDGADSAGAAFVKLSQPREWRQTSVLWS